MSHGERWRVASKPPKTAVPSSNRRTDHERSDWWSKSAAVAQETGAAERSVLGVGSRPGPGEGLAGIGEGAGEPGRTSTRGSAGLRANSATSASLEAGTEERREGAGCGRTAELVPVNGRQRCRMR